MNGAGDGHISGDEPEALQTRPPSLRHSRRVRRAKKKRRALAKRTDPVAVYHITVLHSKHVLSVEMEKICDGGGNPAVKLACSPFVLTYRAVKAYLLPCFGAYTRGCAGLMTDRLCGCMEGCYAYEDREWNGPQAIGKSDDWSFDHTDVEWIRVEELAVSKEKPMVLYQGRIESGDCKQGEVGNCWLVAVFACLTEHPAAIKRIILNPQKNIRGKYQVRLWDGGEKKWVIITVDDRIPCKRGSKETLFMKPNGNEFWAIILEKALAKYFGSYAAMDGNHSFLAMHTLTGDHVFRLSKHHSDDCLSTVWHRVDLRLRKGESRNAAGFSWDNFEDEVPEVDLFNILRQYSRAGSLMTTSFEKNSMNGGPKLGLVLGHAYSVLNVDEFGSLITGKKKLVKLRNPWGQYGEWKGPWGDDSKEWEQNGGIAKEVDHQNENDGIFWMSFEHFVEFAKRIDICDRTTKHDLVLDYDHDHPLTGPVQGCVTGCASFWCLCQGPKHVYFGRQSSSKTRRVKTCGCISADPESD